MYIEFRLPNGAGGMAAGYALSAIRKDIESWADKHAIPYRTKLHKYTFRLCLNSDREYTQFALTWNPEHDVSNYFVFINPK
jgi:hypothetical protein